jgi:hypothetical protein
MQATLELSALMNHLTKIILIANGVLSPAGYVSVSPRKILSNSNSALNQQSNWQDNNRKPGSAVVAAEASL